MIDKILKVNDREAIIYFTHKSPVKLHSSESNVEELIVMMVSPFSLETKTYSSMIIRMAVCNADTLTINLDEVA